MYRRSGVAVRGLLTAFVLAGAAEAATVQTIRTSGAFLDGFTLGGFGAPVVNDAGSLAYVATTRDAQGAERTDGAIILNGAIAARAGDAAPGLAGETFQRFSPSLALNDRGQFGFVATLGDPDGPFTGDLALFVGARPVLRVGDPSPFVGATITGLCVPSLDAMGQAVTLAFAGGRSAAMRDTEALLTSGLAPPFPAAVGDRLVGLQTPRTNATGRTVTVGTLRNTLTGIENVAVMMDGDGIIRRGTDPIPQRPGLRFGSFSDPLVNALGQVLFAAFPTTDEGAPADTILFLDDRILFQSGDPAPGTGGATIAGVRNFALDNDGNAVVLVNLGGPGVTPENFLAIFVVNPAGQLKLLVRSADAIQAGDLGETAFGRLSLSREAISRSGLAFQSTLASGGSGVFFIDADTYAATTVPLPASGVLLIGAVLLLAARRRR